MGTQWLTVIYSLLTCFGGGTLAFLGISELAGVAPKTRKVAAGAAALLLLAAGCAFVASLGHPDRIMAVATNAIKGSPKSLEFVAMVACLVCAVVYVIVAVRSESETPAKAVAVVGLVLGVLMAVAAGTSASLGRASWTGIVLPLAYLGSGLTMGGSLFCSVVAVRGEEPRAFALLSRIALGAVALQAIAFVVLAACSGWTVDVVVYWVGAMVVGTVVPAACLVLSAKVRAVVFVALACSVVGAVCVRLAVVSLGTTGLGLIATATSRAPIMVG